MNKQLRCLLLYLCSTNLLSAERKVESLTDATPYERRYFFARLRLIQLDQETLSFNPVSAVALYDLTEYIQNPQYDISSSKKFLQKCGLLDYEGKVYPSTLEAFKKYNPQVFEQKKVEK